ncbi:MAG: O-methyltransferase [Caldilineaceae bacterium]|nr:O-methyltransferase [Caldilineaceae bacterium]
MFHSIPERVQARMDELERIDARDRVDGTARLRRLRQISPETGRFLALLAAMAPAGDCLEIGTSAGYSTLWLSLACRLRGSIITTFEVLEEKAALARQTFAAAGVEDVVRFVHGDARDYLPDYAHLAFCFLDAEKDIYQPCYDIAIPRLVSGGILAADNVISHGAELAPFVAGVLEDPRVDATIAPVGKGILICRKL